MKRECPIVILVSVSALLFVIHQYLQKVAHVHLVFLDNYLDPVLLMPMLLYAVLWERRILLKNKQITLSNTELLGYFILMVILGEVLLPLLSNKFTVDYWDSLAYALGTLLYVSARKISNFKNSRRFTY